MTSVREVPDREGAQVMGSCSDRDFNGFFLVLSLLYLTSLLLDDSAAANVVERIQDMTMALMESEECMERIACEMGGLAEDVGISKSMTK